MDYTTQQRCERGCTLLFALVLELQPTWVLFFLEDEKMWEEAQAPQIVTTIDPPNQLLVNQTVMCRLRDHLR